MRLLKCFLLGSTLLLPSLASAQDLVEDTFIFPTEEDERAGPAAPRMVNAGDGAVTY